MPAIHLRRSHNSLPQLLSQLFLIIAVKMIELYQLMHGDEKPFIGHVECALVLMLENYEN